MKTNPKPYYVTTLKNQQTDMFRQKGTCTDKQTDTHTQTRNKYIVIILVRQTHRVPKTWVAGWHCASGKFLRVTLKIALRSFRTLWKISR